MRVESPTKQHDRAAEKILARRARGFTNDKPAEGDEDAELENEETPTDGNEVEDTSTDVDDTNDTDVEDDGEDLDAVEDADDEDAEDEDPYQELSIKQLRKLCDSRMPKITYKKKATKPQLIAFLKGE